MKPFLLLVLIFAGASSAESDLSAPLREGLELARAGKWEDARAALLTGLERAPRDKRYFIELAGLAYKSGGAAQAEVYLRRALALDPQDVYSNDALGALHLLSGNLDAALWNWNRIGKPRIHDVIVRLSTKFDPSVARRAVEINPGSVLLRSDLEATRMNLNRLSLRQYRIELIAREAEQFDVRVIGSDDSLAGRGLRGYGISLASGLPYESVTLSFAPGSPWLTNVRSLIRWDANKRRLNVGFTGLVGKDPRLQYKAWVDGRDEKWQIRNGDLVLPTFQMRRLETGAELVRGVSGRLTWVNSALLSVRDYRGPAPARSAQSGPAVQAASRLLYDAFRDPDKRLDITVEGGGEIGRVLTSERPFGRLRASLNATWEPDQAQSFMISSSFSAAKSVGTTPFDELYMLGMERDNDLWLRGHLGAYEGRKGSAPMGGDYVLTQSEVLKTLWRSPFLKWQLGPFLDTGTVSGRFGSHGWLCDTGIQSKLRLPGSLALVAVVGHDLRKGGGVVFYTAIQHP